MVNCVKTKLNYCPICNHKLDAATASDNSGVMPSPNDVTICINCTSYLVYDEDLNLHEMSMESLLKLPDELRLELHRLRKQLKAITRAKDAIKNTKS